MITVNRKSWHYRALDFFAMSSDATKNLCTYVRHLVLWLPFMILFWATLVGGFLFLLVVSPFLLWFGYHEAATMVPVTIGSFLVWALTGWGVYKCADEIPFGQYEITEKRNEPSLLMEYLRAAKAKVCPTIDVK